MLLVCLLFAQTVLFFLALDKTWKFGVRTGARAAMLEITTQLREAAVRDLKPRQQPSKN